MNYTVKFVLIIGIVAVVSFFTASLVIPEKNAVAPSRKSVQKSMASAPPLVGGGGDMLVVVADGKPAEKPIKVSEGGPALPDIEALTPVANAPAGAKAPPAAAPAETKAPAPTTNAPVNAKVPPAVAAAMPPGNTKAAPPPADPKSATFSPKIDTAAGGPFASARATQVYSKSAPPNTMAAQFNKAAAPGAATTAVPAAPTVAATAPAGRPPQTAPLPAALPVATIAVPPDTARKRKPDPNAPLGYKLATAAVCAGVENRAPKGVADKFSKESGAVYYFTHLVGATTDSAAVMHRWYREGKLIQTSILEIKSPNWRTHSKRNLTTVDEPEGNWKVEVVDRRSGKVLESASFVVE